MRVVVHTWDPGFERPKPATYPGIREAVASLTPPPAGGCYALSGENEAVRYRPDPWVALGSPVVATNAIAAILPDGILAEAKGWNDILRWRLRGNLPIGLGKIPEKVAFEPPPVDPVPLAEEVAAEREPAPSEPGKPLLGNVDYLDDFLAHDLADTKIPASLLAYLASVEIHTVGQAVEAKEGVLSGFVSNRIKEPAARLRKEVADQYARWQKALASAPPPDPAKVPAPASPEEAVRECREMGLLWSLRAAAIRDGEGYGKRLLDHLGLDGPVTDPNPRDVASIAADAVRKAEANAGWPQVLSGELRGRQDAGGRLVFYEIGLDAWWRGMTREAVRRLCVTVAKALYGDSFTLGENGHTLVFGAAVAPPADAEPEPQAPATAEPTGLRRLAAENPTIQAEPPVERFRSAAPVPVPTPVPAPVVHRTARRVGLAKAAFVDPGLIGGGDVGSVAILNSAMDVLIESGILFMVAPSAARRDGETGESLLKRAGFAIYEEITCLAKFRPIRQPAPGQAHEPLKPGVITQAYNRAVAGRDKLQRVTTRILVAGRGKHIPFKIPKNDDYDDLAMSTNDGSTFWTCFHDDHLFPQGFARMCLQHAGVGRNDRVVDFYPGGNSGLALACARYGITRLGGWDDIEAEPSAKAIPVSEPA